MTRNLLLGFGEKLISPMDRPATSGDKKDPYTYEENKKFLLPRIEQVIDRASQLPKSALAQGHIVTKLTLHPTYLAKSYYPESILKKTNLRDLGSKPVIVSPRKVTSKKVKESYISSCIYVAASVVELKTFLRNLNNDELNKSQKYDFTKIEDIEIQSADDRIKSISQNEKLTKYEVVIHTPDNGKVQQVLEKFATFASSFGGSVNLNKSITVSGLTFLPLVSIKDAVRNIADYTYLRALRVMSDLRFLEPVIGKNIANSSSPKLPVENALDPDIKVAIFDGGMGPNNVGQWCTEVTHSSVLSESKLVSHGAEVTSCFLFGDVEPNQKQLPTPFANVVHHRVIDSSTDTSDVDLLDILKRITTVLDQTHYDFINLSVGPRLPIEDDEVHAWTAILEPYLTDGKTLMTVAVGNDGELKGEQNRIQTPADLVNALAVGAANTKGELFLNRAPYSCVGPGRSPGVVKPDILAFGGVDNEPVRVYSPHEECIVNTAGTSFAAPLALRMAVGLKATMKYDASPLLAKALLIHHTQYNNLPRNEVGWGRIPTEISDIVYCNDNEITVIYRDEVAAGAFIRAQVPFPDEEIKGEVYLKATFCYATAVDAEHPIHYTRSGLVVKFKPHGAGNDSYGFFTGGNLNQSESELREGAHKWENTLCHGDIFKKEELTAPCFEINHQTRKAGNKTTEADPLPFILVITIRADKMPNLYNSILQKYQVLQPIQTKINIPIRT